MCRQYCDSALEFLTLDIDVRAVAEDRHIPKLPLARRPDHWYDLPFAQGAVTGALQQLPQTSRHSRALACYLGNRQGRPC